jgi:hypothetical protein
MAPEQARGQWEQIDGRTDIYGLGAVLYFLLTGKPPHPGKSVDESLKHAREGVVRSPRELSRSVPRDLERIVMKALEADPTRRYSTASELRRAVRRRRRAYRYWTLGLAGGLLFIVAAAYAVTSWLTEKPVGRFVVPPQPQELVKVDRDGRQFLLKEAVPLVSGDKLWIDWSLPVGWRASAFWFDTEGHLTELAPLKIVEEKSGDRISYPADGAISLAGPPGTEFVFICARQGSRVGQAEVAALLPIGKPFAVLPNCTVICLFDDSVSVSRDTSGASRSPGPLGSSAARDAIQGIEEARRRLSSKGAYLVGVAFAHVDAAAPPAESSATAGGLREHPLTSGSDER